MLIDIVKLCDGRDFRELYQPGRSSSPSDDHEFSPKQLERRDREVEESRQRYENARRGNPS